MAKKYVVQLAADERERLGRITRTGKGAAWRIQRAHALLECDQGPHGPGWTDERIAEALEISVRSVEHWRQQAVEDGPESLLEREARATPPITPKLDGEGEAQLVKLACSQPPEGRANWTLRLLAAQLVELEVVESISYETVRRVLKKTSSSPG